MDILWSLLTLPYAPVRGLTSVVKVIAREAESRQHNPVNIRRELEELDRAAAAGDITPQERDRGQQQVLDRLTGGVGSAPPAGPATAPPPPAPDAPGPARPARARAAATGRNDRRGGGTARRGGTDRRRGR